MSKELIERLQSSLRVLRSPIVANATKTTAILTKKEHGELVEEIEAVILRIADLESIVDRLPKTADGVPVIKGDRVWAWFSDGLHRVAYRSGDRAHKENPHVCGPTIEHTYSTRAAAEAARRSRPHTGEQAMSKQAQNPSLSERCERVLDRILPNASYTAWETDDERLGDPNLLIDELAQCVEQLKAENRSQAETNTTLQNHVEVLTALCKRAVPKIHDDESTSASELRDDLLVAMADPALDKLSAELSERHRLEVQEVEANNAATPEKP